MSNTCVKMAQEICIKCGIVFSVAKDYQDERQDDYEGFYCPNGHLQYYVEPPKSPQVTHSAYKGQITRLKRRIVADVCPFCGDFFGNLQKHFAAKHPKMVKKYGEKK